MGLWTNKEIKIEKIFSLTPTQKGILVSKKLYGESMYMVQKRITVKGNLDRYSIDETLDKLVQKYEVLRTFFVLSTIKEPKQVVLKERTLKAGYMDLTSKTNSETEAFIQAYIESDWEKGFDISKEILVRLCIIQTESSKFELLWTFHHIIIDGWSTGILLNDFMQIYAEIRNGKTVDISEVNKFSPYVEYITENRKNDSKYWKSYLEDYEKVAVIEGSNQNKEAYKYTLLTERFRLPPKLYRDIKMYINDQKVTMNTLMQAVWGTLLHKYNNSNDVVFGYVASGRNVELEGIIEKVGLFINTVPLRVKAEEDYKFIELVRKIYEEYTVHQIHETASLIDVQESTNLKNKLIQNLLVFENYPFDEKMNASEAIAERGFEILGISGDEQSNYDLNIVVIPSVNMEIEIIYNGNIYAHADISRIFQRIKYIFCQIIENPGIKWRDISICCEEEKNLIMEWSQNTAVSYPKDVCIHDIFSEQAKRTPNNIAVTDVNGSMTYKELDEKSNQLAHKLRKMKVDKNQMIGICVEKSKELIVGILAILKAGGAYVPIDPQYPEYRINYMLLKSETKIVLTGENGPEIDERIQKINIFCEALYKNHRGKEAVTSINKQKDIAYVIFTSGTTGNPKGVMIEHNSLVRLLFNESFQFDFSEQDVWTMFHSACFDFSVWEMYGALLYGGKLVVVSKEQAREVQEFIHMIEQENVTVLNQVPSSLYNLIAYENKTFPKLRYLITGGEALSPNKIIEWKKINPQTKIINMYGITETTVHTTYKEITDEDAKKKISNIGKPLPTLDVYIMNDGILCGIGIVGEICVAGEGLARGYMSNKVLTAEKFVYSKTLEGKRLYKSGDVGRWIDSGEIEYIGRLDEQVKIRGFRIELKEIEQVMIQQENVKQATALIKTNSIGDKLICAFLVGDELDVDKVKSGMRGKLPDYMMPHQFVKLDKLPLTKNGKINKKEMLSNSEECKVTYVAPDNDIEKKLCFVFGDILHMKKIGVDNNFFELGGHSLNATVLEAQIANIFGVQIPLVEIFKYPTVKEIAAHILEKQNSKTNHLELIPRAVEKEYYSLSSFQEGIYTTVKLGNDNGTMNIVLPLIFEKIVLDIFKETLGALIKRHYSLRTRIDVVDGTPVQKVLPYNSNMSNYELIDLSGKDNQNETIENLLQKETDKPFDIQNKSLVRFKMVKLTRERYMFVFTLHHIISDAWSFDVLLSDMTKIYEAKCKKEEAKMKELQIHYVDFAEWEQENLKSARQEVHKNYWKSVLKQPLPVLKLKTDYNRPPIKKVSGQGIDYEFNRDKVEKLKMFANQNGGTPFMTLVTAVYALLHCYTGQNDLIIGIPVAGREHLQLQELMGYFLNILPLRANITGEETLIDAYAKVKAVALNAYKHQEYPFTKMLQDNQIVQEQTHSPVFDVMIQQINTVNGLTTSFGGVKMEVYQRSSIQSKYDLVFNFMDSIDGLKLRLEYSTALFKEETVIRLMERLKRIMEVIAENPDQIINKIFYKDTSSSYILKLPRRSNTKREERSLR